MTGLVRAALLASIQPGFDFSAPHVVVEFPEPACSEVRLDDLGITSSPVDGSMGHHQHR